jgi:hypothetical protein
MARQACTPVERRDALTSSNQGVAHKGEPVLRTGQWRKTIVQTLGIHRPTENSILRTSENR